MRFLPAPMREPISLGYLLARASDTIADEVGLKATDRLEALALLEAAIETGESKALEEILEHRFIPLVKLEKEKYLLAELGDILKWYQSLKGKLQVVIKKVVLIIISGQRLDVERFEMNHQMIESERELYDYCYQVAGCVGEFWTEVGFLTLDKYSKLEQAQLMQWGKSYGIGLQLINIIRDAPKDIANGRCYVPNMTSLDKARIEPFIEVAKKGMQDGLCYAKSLKNKRAKMATAMPAIIGLNTLDLIEKANVEEWGNGVKVSRGDVYMAMLKGLFL